MTKLVLLALLSAMEIHAAEKWATVWTGSIHGPFPVGNPVAQPDLHEVFPDASAKDQTFRLVVKPGLWSSRIRLRFSNVLGSRPVKLDGVFVGVHASAGRLLPGTNRPVHFNRATRRKGNVALQIGHQNGVRRGLHQSPVLVLTGSQCGFRVPALVDFALESFIGSL